MHPILLWYLLMFDKILGGRGSQIQQLEKIRIFKTGKIDRKCFDSEQEKNGMEF